MLQIYSENVTVNSNSSFPLNNIVIEKGNTATVQGNTIQFNKAGIYYVAVDASVEPSAAALMTIGLTKNGQSLPYAGAQANGTTGNTTALAFSTLIRCPQNNTNCCLTAPTVITIDNETEDANLTGSINIVVTKIC